MAQPLKKFSAGTVVAAVWENEITLPSGENKTILKASLERRYKDRDGSWKSSCSFGRNEIPLARHVLQQAFECMLEEHSANGTVAEELVR